MVYQAQHFYYENALQMTGEPMQVISDT